MRTGVANMLPRSHPPIYLGLISHELDAHRIKDALYNVYILYANLLRGEDKHKLILSHTFLIKKNTKIIIMKKSNIIMLIAALFPDVKLQDEKKN